MACEDLPLCLSSILRVAPCVHGHVFSCPQWKSKNTPPANPGDQKGPSPDLALIHVLTHNGKGPNPDMSEFKGFKWRQTLTVHCCSCYKPGQ